MHSDDHPNTTTQSRRPVGRAVIALALVSSLLIAVVAPAAAQQQVDRPALVVDLQADGSGDVTLVLTYDLTTETERQAFRSIQENESTLSAIQTRFDDRMTAIAAATSQATDRDVRVTATSVTLDTTADGETGIVRLSATIDNLAAVEGDQLVLTEPFSSGYYADRDVIIRYPDDYTVSSVSPTPDSQAEGELTWESGTDFDGFELVLAADEGGDGGTGVTNPGFGIGVALVALLGSILLVYHRRR